MDAGDAASVDALLAGIDRGLYVCRLHYVNGLLEPRRAVMTGLTRDGCFLVEKGKITRAVGNLRFTDSLLEGLARCDGRTRAQPPSRRGGATRELASSRPSGCGASGSTGGARRSRSSRERPVRARRPSFQPPKLLSRGGAWAPTPIDHERNQAAGACRAQDAITVEAADRAQRRKVGDERRHKVDGDGARMARAGRREGGRRREGRCEGTGRRREQALPLLTPGNALRWVRGGRHRGRRRASSRSS